MIFNMTKQQHFCFTTNAADLISASGIVQAALATRADYDRKELSKRLHNRKPLRASSAHRIAQAFADLAHIGKEEAFAKLFEDAPEPSESPV